MKWYLLLLTIIHLNTDERKSVEDTAVRVLATLPQKTLPHKEQAKRWLKVKEAYYKHLNSPFRNQSLTHEWWVRQVTKFGVTNSIPPQEIIKTLQYVPSKKTKNFPK